MCFMDLFATAGPQINVQTKRRAKNNVQNVLGKFKITH